MCPFCRPNFYYVSSILTAQWCQVVNRLLLLGTATFYKNNHHLIGMHSENTYFFPSTFNAYEESKHTQLLSVEQSALLQVCLTLQKT